MRQLIWQHLGVAEVLRTLLMNVVTNPVQSLVSANYIGILVWAVLIGIALRKALIPPSSL